MPSAVLHRELTIEFGLSATSLGGLTVLYFFSYTAMQIPTGLLADSLGPRRLLAWVWPLLQLDQCCLV